MEHHRKVILRRRRRNFLENLFVVCSDGNNLISILRGKHFPMGRDRHRSVIVLKMQVSPSLGKKRRNRPSSGKLATSFLLLNSSHSCCRCDCDRLDMAPIASSRNSRSPDGLSITNKTEDNETSLVLTIGEEYISQW